ncbi:MULTISPECIES: hypothetical protein [Methylomonas]|uniref:Uncharacterized protein n=2 Tax=Methylomonas TaxID=416 RepID=A0A140E3N8_9GAMM|nr:MULTISPECIES: hypothetical protein [Methylomonas]AMK75012.1 hypothetical protein JT25_000685 [Methylomonas denitrificans]OAI02508.1 hypothetical protein A1342_01675 [Methylomonas methanica]TCV83174.1 hypothetical protein EDE11_110133 [Methylomonas methanica]
MKIAKIGNTGIAMLIVVIASLLGILPMGLVFSILLFAALMRGSVMLIEKAIDNAAQTKEVDRH